MSTPIHSLASPRARPSALSVAARVAACLALLAPPQHLSAQQRPAPDSARSDSIPAARLPEVSVTGTLRSERLERVPWAVGIVEANDLRRAQATVNLDEALTLVPGVFVANRYNFAVDSRLSVRGFGSRANFGVRGVRVVLDGVPQTLPDGQSQLTNIELGAIGRVEVLRGASSALYGNGSGGVVSFTSDLSAPDPFQQTVRVEGGSFGMLKWQSRTAGRTGAASGALSLSRFTWDGFRPHSAAEIRQLNAAVDYAISPATTASLRVNVADMPEALNPGALTAEEYTADFDTASTINILRGADKRVKQNQLSLRIQRTPGGRAVQIDASAFALTRDLQNALGAAAPPPAGPTNGVYATLDREAYGARISAGIPLGGAGAPRLVLGAEVQKMRDLRENSRATGGRPTEPGDTLLLSQVESVRGVGPFAQLAWAPSPRLTLSAGGRYDQVRFEVSDRFLGDGDASGNRTLPAWSGHLGASFAVNDALTPYVNVSTSFETPTTTELQARPDASGGFNENLGPQRATSFEAGARGRLLNDRLSYSAAFFHARVTDAIVQFLEIGSRAFFANAGATQNSGAELGMSARLASTISVEAAYTFARYRFDEYRVARGEMIDTLDGNRLPGIPDHFLRAGLRTSPLPGVTLDADHIISSAVYADDANALRVEGWGPGVTNVRVAWQSDISQWRIQPFAAVQNVFGTRYVSAVTVNGFNGRVREPAPGRNFFLGAELTISIP